MRTTSINPPANATFNEIAVSPNGKLLAFTATSEDKRQLWVRPLHNITANVLSGTEHATDPFWSPDSSWIGFFKRFLVPIPVEWDVFRPVTVVENWFASAKK